MSLFVLLVGWVRCFVLDDAAKVLLFSDFGRLAKGQYQSCCPLWRKSVFLGIYIPVDARFHLELGRNLTKNYQEKNASIPKKFGGI